MNRKKVFVTIALIANLLICETTLAQYEQVIGQFPTIEGSFEKMQPGTLETTPLNTGCFTTSTSNLPSIISTEPNSGFQSLEFPAAGTSGDACFKISGLQPNTKYTLQFFAKRLTSAANVLTVGFAGINGVALVSTTVSINTANYMLFSTSLLTPSSINPEDTYYLQLKKTSGSRVVRVDDLCLYEGDAPSTDDEGFFADNINPYKNENENGNVNIWWDASSNKDRTGYIVYKFLYDEDEYADIFDQNTIWGAGYSEEEFFEIVYIGQGTSCLVDDPDAVYAVVAVDKAFNYSKAIFATTQPIPSSDDARIYSVISEDGTPATIDNNKNTIAIYVDPASDFSNICPAIIIPDGAIINKTCLDLSAGKIGTYTVTGADGITNKTYSVAAFWNKGYASSFLPPTENITTEDQGDSFLIKWDAVPYAKSYLLTITNLSEEQILQTSISFNELSYILTKTLLEEGTYIIGVTSLGDGHEYLNASSSNSTKEVGLIVTSMGTIFRTNYQPTGLTPE